MFWPDLTSSHYGHDVLQYLNQNDVQFVDKEFNPQTRPIETLWSILKNIVYDEEWEAKTIDRLQRRIAKKLILKLSNKCFQAYEKQLRKVADNGPYEACSF